MRQKGTNVCPDHRSFPALSKISTTSNAQSLVAEYTKWSWEPMSLLLMLQFQAAWLLFLRIFQVTLALFSRHPSVISALQPSEVPLMTWVWNFGIPIIRRYDKTSWQLQATCYILFVSRQIIPNTNQTCQRHTSWHWPVLLICQLR